MNKLYNKCPNCGFDLDGGLIIVELRKQEQFNQFTDEELIEYIGQTYTHPYRFSKAIGIELQDDRTNYYICPECKQKI